MTRAGLAKAALTIAGIILFLWAQNDDQTTLRWVAIGMIVAAWMLRFVERGNRQLTSEGEVPGASEGEGKSGAKD